MTTEQIKEDIQGVEWISIAPEIRPSALKTADGSIKPFYLTRVFTYLPNDRFDLVVTNYADAYGKVPLAQMHIQGHTHWKGAHPIAEGAQKVDFIADEAYFVTPLHRGFADTMNVVAKEGYDKWQVGEKQSIFKKAFPPFGLAQEQVFSECDLIYLSHDLMFWGARNVDGIGFDKEENRPTNLQIPMMRRKK